MNDAITTGEFAPPQWSLLLGSTGRGLIPISAALFVLCAILWILAPRWKRLEGVAKITFTLGTASLFGAFGVLAFLFAENRFEYEYVYGHSDHANALAYRIAGIWSGQQGSFLLWAVCSAIFAALYMRRTEVYRRWYTIVHSLFLGAICAILAFESPFNLNLVEGRPFVPADGLGLAPSLQNYWVIIHPPTIFLGFGALTSLFAIATAALALRDFESWIPIVRPWAIVACTLLGLGLCMGGFWAYETLGWGGFWMWDPVENVSFVPWCFTAAFFHGIIVQKAKSKWHLGNALMGGLPFIIYVYGTFLTRLGLLSDASVHSFSEMDRSALKLLVGVMTVATLGFLGIWGFRAFQARGKAAKAPTEAALRREAFYAWGITLLMGMGVATGIGMSVPLFQALRGEKPRVVEEAVYHQVLVWLFVPLLFVMAATPLVAWKGMKAKELGSRLYTVLCIAVGLTGLFVFLTVVTPFGRKLDLAAPVTMLGRFPVPALGWISFLVGLCLFAVVANVWAASGIVKRSRIGISSFVTHIGVAMLMLGMVVSRGFEHKGQSMVMQGMPARLLNYEVRYQGMSSNVSDRNNQLKLAIYDAHKQGEPLFVATPGLYKVQMADGQESNMVWPHVERGWLMDTYVSLGQPQENATQEITLGEGESFKFGDAVLTYQHITRKGEPGKVGTRFGALVSVERDGNSRNVNPQMEIGGEQGVIEHPVKVADNLELAMVGMDVAKRQAKLRLQLTSAIYPIEIYHKPLTSFVWLGTGLMTFGGFMAALYRRVRRAAPAAKPVVSKTPDPELRPILVGDKA